MKKSIAFITILFLISCSPSSNNTEVKQTSDGTQSSSASTEHHKYEKLSDFATLVNHVGNAVVNISTIQKVKQTKLPDISKNDPFYDFFRHFTQPPSGSYHARSLGSGFIITEDGYILTNNHVLENADQVTVKLTDAREFKAQIIGTDPMTDLALIKINATQLPKVLVGNPDHLKAGEWVAAIGSPFGFESSVTAGIVSAKGRWLSNDSYAPFIQTDVAVNPGNSGGPLFNLYGEVVGINSQIYSRTGGYMGVSFAIPINIAIEISDQLRSTGKVKRGKIGVQIQELTQDLAQSFGLNHNQGVLVAEVDKGSPADKAGILAGDVILQFQDKTITETRELPMLVSKTLPGSTVKLQIWRQGAAQNINVTIDELKPGKHSLNRRR